jgi:hypothetical protein
MLVDRMRAGLANPHEADCLENGDKIVEANVRLRLRLFRIDASSLAFLVTLQVWYRRWYQSSASWQPVRPSEGFGSLEPHSSEAYACALAHDDQQVDFGCYALGCSVAYFHTSRANAFGERPVAILKSRERCAWSL